MPSRTMRLVERGLKRLPAARRMIEQRLDSMMEEIEGSAHPYAGRFPSYARLPETGRTRADLLTEMEALAALEEERWRSGRVSGAVYHGDADHIAFTNRVYALHSQSNPLHADVWPSAAKFEGEIVAMAAHMLGKGDAAPDVCGTVTSGGTESILLAMKAYRDRARAERNITRPEVVLPVTAHVAFDKAAHYFGIRLMRTPVGADGRADATAMAQAITKNTIALVGSAPCFPYGVVDPLETLSALAVEHGIGLHTDACLGGFVLPWAGQLGAPVPPFDFCLPGVTSLSADTHKYGYAPKGTSVVLYRTPELRRYQYFTATDWPGGLYYSPTLAGSRPGALSAACWATLVSTGAAGYRDATARILAAAGYIRACIERMPDLEVIGDPLWIVAFRSHTLDIYRILDAMSARGWSLNGLHRPPAVHLAVTLRHTEPGVAQAFIDDLREAVAAVRAQPQAKGGMAPVYGMAGTLPLRGLVDDLLRRYIDALYTVR